MCLEQQTRMPTLRQCWLNIVKILLSQMFSMILKAFVNLPIETHTQYVHLKDKSLFILLKSANCDEKSTVRDMQAIAIGWLNARSAPFGRHLGIWGIGVAWFLQASFSVMRKSFGIRAGEWKGTNCKAKKTNCKAKRTNCKAKMINCKVKRRNCKAKRTRCKGKEARSVVERGQVAEERKKAKIRRDNRKKTN